MKYRPLTEKEANEMSKPALLQDGQYQFMLIEYSHTDKYHNELVDRNNEPMTKIKLKIWDINGKETFIFTNLFWGSNNKMSYRTRNFANSVGFLESYEKGDFYENFGKCLESTGYCEIYTQKERPKNDGSGTSWPAKNEIKDFIKNNSINKKDKDQFDDEIPF